jgi:hypothetical protein
MQLRSGAPGCLLWPQRTVFWPSLRCVTQYNEQVWWRAKQADNEVLISVAFNTLRPGPIWIWIPWNDPPSGAETTINSKWQQWRLLSSESHDERVLPHLPSAGFALRASSMSFLTEKSSQSAAATTCLPFNRSRVRYPKCEARPCSSSWRPRFEWSQSICGR